MHKLLFVIISTTALLAAAAYLAIYGFLNSAAFFGVQPTAAEQKITALCYFGAIICLMAIYFVFRFSRKINK